MRAQRARLKSTVSLTSFILTNRIIFFTMAISSLSDDHHAVRHVSYQLTDRDDITG